MRNSGWVRVDGRLWTDRKFLALSTEARLLFVWSWQPPHATVCGLYSASLKQLGRAVGDPVCSLEDNCAERVGGALEELGAARMLKYDPEAEVVWAVNRVKFVEPLTSKVLTLMRREVAACPDSPLVDEFLSRWGKHLGLTRA